MPILPVVIDACLKRLIVDIISKSKRVLKRSWLRYRGYRVGELPKVNLDFAERPDDSRLNLVLLGGSKEDSYGGAETAIRFFNSIRRFYSRSRLIFLSGKRPARSTDLSSVTVSEGHLPSSVYIEEKDFRLPVETNNDHFIATHWITAHYVSMVREAQKLVRRPPQHPFIYLIQDFEPGFYPWSSRYLLAAATYAKPNETIAVFNTALLKSYFDSVGLVFPLNYVFEPKLNDALALYKERIASHKKRRLILVYGRPASPRNAFELVVETLSIFAQRYDRAHEWELLSLGEMHSNVKLPRGLTLRSEGKVSLDRYALHLLDAAVGFSLMVSPHPSYPPLEMAEFGAKVITNGFANKNLSARAENIISVDDVRPENLAKVLIDACEAHYARPEAVISHSAFLGRQAEFPFSEELASRLLNQTKLRNSGIG